MKPMPLALCLLFFGCTGADRAIARGAPHLRQGQDSLEAARYEECVKEMTAAIDEYRPRSNGGHWVTIQGERTYSLFGRGRCYKGLGRYPEALADLEEALHFEAIRCRYRAQLRPGEDPCKQTADILEAVAQVKKAMAAKP